MGAKKLLGGLVVLAAIVGIVFALVANNPANTSQQSVTTTTPQTASLDYSNRGLTHFPKEILNNKSVTSLNLSHNNLTGALPAEIRQLSNLQNLDVSYNSMTGIPAEIGQLHSLKTLNYSYNQITGLPLELGNLTQLQVFDLRGNNPSQQDLSQIRAKLTNTEIKL